MISCTKSKQKQIFICEISEIHAQTLTNEETCAQILNKRRNLCTNLNKPTRLHQDRHLKTSSFDNYLVSFNSKSMKIILKFKLHIDIDIEVQPTIVFVRIIYH